MYVDTERGKGSMNFNFQFMLIWGINLKNSALLFHDPHDGQSVLILWVLQTMERNPGKRPWVFVSGSCSSPSCHSHLMSFLSFPWNDTDSADVFRGPVLPCSWRAGQQPGEGESQALNHLSLLVRPPGRGGRRAGPSEIKFHKVQPWYLLFTQQLNWLNNCLPGIAGSEPSLFLPV